MSPVNQPSRLSGQKMAAKNGGRLSGEHCQKNSTISCDKSCDLNVNFMNTNVNR